MAQTIFHQSNFSGGIQPYFKTSIIPNGYYFGYCVDYRQDPQNIILQPATVKESGNVVTDLIKWGDIIPQVNVSFQGGNLIANPSFEVNTTGWSLDGDYTRSNTKAFDGTWSVKQVSTANFANFYTATGGIAVFPNTNYVLTFWAFITVSSGLPPLFQINTTDAFTSTIPNTYFSLSDTGGQWQQFSVSFNSGQTSKVWLRIFNNQGTVTAYYDLFELQQTDTLLSYFYGNIGNIYRRTGFSNTAQWQFLHQAPSSHGNGLAYFFADDFLYYAADSWIGRYGPLSNNPQFSDNFLQSQGGTPLNTNSLSLTAASSMYATAADSATLSITSDLTLEAFFYANSLPGTGASMTLIGKWDESGATRSYKLDIYGLSAYFGDGSDGALTISTNTTEAPIDSACTGTVGSQSLAATNASFAQGQVILIHQTQGTNAGLWERNTIQAYTAGVITTGTPLKTDYTLGAQVRVEKQYSSVTINNAVTYTAKAWNGTVGGIMAFLNSGTMTNNGSISANFVGFRGGATATIGDDTVGRQGEGTAGAGGTQSAAANGNGGGGGGKQSGHFGGSGGGGGGNGTNGSDGAFSNGNSINGTGGDLSGTTDLTTMSFGGGGGGSDGVNFSSAGGTGGGNIFITSVAITNAGGITARGASGGASGGGESGGGGGGAGGSILLKAQVATLGSGLIIASGGTGGAGSNGFNGAGGDGAAGRIHLDYLVSFTGTTTPALNATQDNTLVTTIVYEARLGISNDGTAFEYLTQLMPNLNVSKWNRLSVAWTASTATATFYLNAILLGSFTGTKTAINDNTSLLYIGADKGSSAIQNFFDGLIDDVRIWSNVQSAGQISQNNLVQLQATSAGLNAYYEFNGTLADTTANGNNLTGHNSPTYSTNVPFADSSIRLDIDQTGGSAASTYTLLTAVSEAASDTLSFTPTNDPQKSIQFTVDTVGGGDWIVIIHDQQNRLIATQTILAANVPAAGGLIEFVFSPPWRIVIGRTYHAHLITTTGTSKIKATTNFSNALFTTYFGFLVTDVDFHPMIQFLNFIAIGNERYIATWDGAFYNPNVIAFPTGWRVRSFSFWREYLAIGVWKGAKINDFTHGRVYFWDGIAPTFNFFIDVPDGQINALWGRDSDLFIVAGYRGDLLDYQGSYFFDTGNSSSIKIRFLPKRSEAGIVEVFPGAMNYYRNLLQVGFAANSTMTGIFKGVYSYGTLDPKIDQTISLDYLTSTGNTGDTVTIGCVYPVGDKLIIGWQDGLAFGADVVDYDNNPPAPHGRIELMITDEGQVWHIKTDYQVRADFLGLRTGENVTVEANIDRETFQTGSILGSTDTSTAAGTNNFCKLITISGREREMQYAVNLYATSSTSPTLLEVSAITDELAEEKQF